MAETLQTVWIRWARKAQRLKHTGEALFIYTTFLNNVMNTVTGIHEHPQASGLPIIYNSIKGCMFDLGTNIFTKYCQKL
jgi:hypothetical protein